MFRKIFLLFFLTIFFGMFISVNFLKAQDLDNNRLKLYDMLKSTYAKERLDAINEIYRIDNDEGFSKICEHYFTENDNYIKKVVVEIVSYKSYIEQCRRVVEDALDNSNIEIKKSAFLSINETMDEELILKIKRKIKEEKNKELRVSAIIKLSTVDKSTEIVKIISDEIATENNLDRLKVFIDALNRIGTKKAKIEAEKYNKKIKTNKKR